MIDHELMRIHLSAAVPLRMAELAHVDQQTLIDEMDQPASWRLTAGHATATTTCAATPKPEPTPAASSGRAQRHDRPHTCRRSPVRALLTEHTQQRRNPR